MRARARERSCNLKNGLIPQALRGKGQIEGQGPLKGQQHLESLVKSFVFGGMEKGVKNSGTGLRRPMKSDS